VSGIDVPCTAAVVAPFWLAIRVDLALVAIFSEDEKNLMVAVETGASLFKSRSAFVK